MSNHHKSLSREAYTDFEIKQLDQSPYIKPYQILFKQNGIQRRWHAIQSHESVSVLLHDAERDIVILVKQFRPPVYIHNCFEKQNLSDPYNIDFSKTNPEDGITYELCSGIVDKDKDLLEITKEEILEECGYDVPLSKIYRVNSFRAGIGIGGAKHTTYYAQVSKSMIKHSGGGNAHEGEFIEVFELPVKDIRSFMRDETKEKPPGLIYSLSWFLYEREAELKEANYGN